MGLLRATPMSAWACLKGASSAIMSHPGAIAGFVRFQPKTGYTRYREWRLSRSDPRIRFAGKIHETVVPMIREISAREGLPIVRTTVEIDHLGYDGDQAHKHARNLALSQTAVRALHPDRVFLLASSRRNSCRPVSHAQEAEAAAIEGLASAERDASDEQRAAASLIFEFLVRSRDGARRQSPRPDREGLGEYAGGLCALVSARARASLCGSPT